jgi:hypothetical protein
MMRALGGLLIVLCLLLESCRSDFNINAPYQDVYVLNCILRNDTSVQYALVSKNYFTTNGAAPAPNSIDQYIKGVDIKIHYDDSVFVMRDTSVQSTDSGNETMVDCYYVNNLTLIPGKVLSIEASIPGGDTLKSTIQVPKIAYSDFSRNFPQLNDTYVATPNYSATPSYSWSWIGYSQENTAILSIPQLEVYYKHYEHGTYIDKMVLIPLAYYFVEDRYGNLSPVDVQLSFRTFCVTKLETVNKTMQDISGDDPDKENYIITKVVFSVIGLDAQLSKYYCAYETYSENFSIKLRQTDFSDIDGGEGIFGLSYKFSKPLTVDSSYLGSFGYRYDPHF